MTTERSLKEILLQESFTLRRSHQIVINNQWGFKVGDRTEKGLVIIIDRPGNWPIYLSTQPERIHGKRRASEDIKTYHFHLPEGEFASLNGYILTVEEIGEESKISLKSSYPTNWEPVHKRILLKRYLSRKTPATSLADSSVLQ